MLGLDRFDWQAWNASNPECAAAARRCASTASLACKCKQVKPDGKDTVLNLLAVEFEATDAPAGVVTLMFSGGPMLRLEVECLEVELVDLGPTWSADTPADPATRRMQPDARR